jgi:ankyrin repeat protein
MTKKGYTPLLTAISNRQTEIAEMLLEKGARPEVKAGDRNALEWAKLVVRAAPNAERKRLVKKLEAYEKNELEAQQQMTKVMANAAAANVGPRE